MPKTAIKVTCYITRGDQLLVFDHPYSPAAGTQVPGGTVDPGETLELAALREAREESGLQDLVLRSYLGSRRYELPQVTLERHYFHLECLFDTPARWTSYEETPSDGSPGPIELAFYWTALPWEAAGAQNLELAGEMGDMLPELQAQLAAGSLLEVVQRQPEPQPWAEGDNIPWHEPGFSARMLKEHLSQEHDAASRRSAKIEQHVKWIHDQALGSKAGRLLDLGCGPGLYSSRLARLGHQVTGIDYSPASIAYARQQAQAEGLEIQYIHGDIREVAFGQGYQAAMLIYGEFNIFRPAHARSLLEKIWEALLPGGVLILEPHTWQAIQEMGRQPASWYSSSSGLFHPKPHLVLEEHYWHAAEQAVTTRFFVVAAQGRSVIRYAQSFQAYSQAQYRDLLLACGFEKVRFYPALTGEPDPEQPALLAVLANKPD